MDPSTPSIPARTAADRRPPPALRIEPFVPRTDHNPVDLMSWAKRTGFNPNLSGESSAASSGAAATPAAPSAPSATATAPPDEGLRRREVADLEIERIHGGRGESRGIEIEREPEPVRAPVVGAGDFDWRYERIAKEKRRNRVEEGPRNDGDGDGGSATAPIAGDEGSKRDVEKGGAELEFDYFSESPERDRAAENRRRSGLRWGLMENPGYGSPYPLLRLAPHAAATAVTLRRPSRAPRHPDNPSSRPRRLQPPRQLPVSSDLPSHPHRPPAARLLRRPTGARHRRPRAPVYTSLEPLPTSTHSTATPRATPTLPSKLSPAATMSRSKPSPTPAPTTSKSTTCDASLELHPTSMSPLSPTTSAAEPPPASTSSAATSHQPPSS